MSLGLVGIWGICVRSSQMLYGVASGTLVEPSMLLSGTLPRGVVALVGKLAWFGAHLARTMRCVIGHDYLR